MWTSRNRARYDRSKLRYPSDVTDEEWELMVPQSRKASDADIARLQSPPSSSGSSG